MKVKNGIKRMLACFLVAVLLLTAAPLAGVAELDFSGIADWFSTTAKAAETYTEGYLKYEVENGEARITDCDTSISGEVVIPSTLGGYKVTSIGNDAFRSCTELASITIPDSVTSIGGSAFEYCTGLTSVTIPDSVTSIGEGAFDGCTGLTSITIPDSVTIIGGQAFYNTSYYNNSDNWENGVLYIGNHLIDAKSSISGTYKIKNETKTIADDAFSYCRGLTSITIPDSVTSIGGSVFSGCRGLTSVTIPNSVTSIGNYAFYGCTGLTSITIPDSVTSIGGSAFYGCTGLTSITIPDSVTSISGSAFSSCNNLEEINVTDGNSVYHSISNCIIKTETKELVVGCKRSIIPTDGSVTSIGSYAFRGCTGLTSITVPGSVTSIGSSAFRECTGLTSITIPDSVTSVGSYAFYNCKNLEVVTLGKNLTSIESEAFKDCARLFEVYNLSGLKIAVGSTDNGYVAYYAAKVYSSLNEKRITFAVKDGFRFLKDNNKYYLSDYIGTEKNITLPKSFEYESEIVTEYDIRSRAFYRSDIIESVHIPDNVKSIGTEAFLGCSKLKTVDTGNGVKDLGTENWFFYNRLSIFSNCSNLENITIGSGVKKIGGKAFCRCTSLKSVIIPANVEGISKAAFNDCYNLEHIYIYNPKCTINSSRFGSSSSFPRKTTIHGYANSEAQSFANENGNPFVEISCDHSAGTVDQTIEATCTEDGKVNKRCSVCNNILSYTVIKALGHSFTNYASDNNATCTADGTKTAKCDKCDVTNTVKDENTALGHSFTNYVSDKNATCTEDGTKTAKCDRCEETATEVVEKLGHDYILKTVIEATCKEKGEQIEVCKRCGETNKKIEVPVKDHRYRAVFDKSVKNGVYLICMDCLEKYFFNGNQYYYKIFVISDNSAYGWDKSCFCLHGVDTTDYLNNTDTSVGNCNIDFIGERVISEGTIDNFPVFYTFDYEFGGGLSHRTMRATFCLKIGNDITDAVNIPLNIDINKTRGNATVDGQTAFLESTFFTSATGVLKATVYHDHYEEKRVISPTCTEKGYTSYPCVLCMKDERDTYTDPLGHDYKPEHFDAADEKDGYTLYTCSRCGDSYKIVDPAAAVEGLTAFSDTHKVSLSWLKAVEASVTGYKLFRKTSAESEYTLYKELDGRETLSYIDADVEVGTVYSYRICAIKGDVDGILSNEIAAAPGSDVTAPIITSVKPVNYSIVNSTVEIAATADDDIGVAGYDVFYSADSGNNWLSIGSVEKSRCSLLFDTKTVSDGNILVKIVARDTSGNASEGRIVNYRIDNTGPDKVKKIEAIETYATSLTFSWSDVEANDRKCFVLQMKSGLNDYSTFAKEITELGYNIKGLTPGEEYTFRVAAVDVLGNVGEFSDDYTVKMQNDTVAPVIRSLSPNSNRYKDNIPFSANVVDDDGYISKVTIQASIDGKTWKNLCTKNYSGDEASVVCNQNVSLDNYSDGSLFLRAVAEDTAGNVSRSSSYVEYMVDKTAPKAPSNVKAVGKGGYIAVSWDIGSEEDLNSYSVYRAENESGSYICIGSSLYKRNYNDTTTKPNTIYCYKVKVDDTAGNISDFSSVVSARMEADTQKPVIQSVTPASGSKIGPSNKQISVFVSDNNKIDRVVIEYSPDGKNFTAFAERTNVAATQLRLYQDLPIDAVNDGETIYVRAYAVDEAGLISDYSEVFQYTVDKSAPDIKNAAVSISEENAVVTWSGNESDLNGYYVYYSKNGSTFKQISTRGRNTTGKYTVTCNLSELGEGKYCFKIVAFDMNGNSSYVITDSVVFDAEIPPIAVISDIGTIEVGVQEQFDSSASSDADGAVCSYHWDFGDGAFSDLVRPIHTYKATGTYTITLTVTDNDGLTAVAEKTVEVVERKLIGTAVITVKDSDGKVIPGAPVFFNIGSENRVVKYADALGNATFSATVGTYKVGVFLNGKYLPVIKTMIVAAQSKNYLTLTVTSGATVDGFVESERMTFEEIEAAGINVTDEANYQQYKTTVKVTYGDSPVNLEIFSNEKGKVHGWLLGDSDNKTGKSNSKAPNIVGVSMIKGSGYEIIAVAEVDAQVRFLKEFFKVKLHVFCNASSDFSVKNCTINLNIPNGLTLVDGIPGYNNAAQITVDEIKGGSATATTFEWIVRGDKEGEYDISADFIGTLSDFDMPVTGKFASKEPLRVYGASAAKMFFDFDSTLRYGALYFNVGLENVSSVDINKPDVETLNNTIVTYTKKKDETKNGDKTDDDKLEAATTRVQELGIVLETENGYKQYLPQLPDVLEPGSRVYRQYVAYGIVDAQEVGYFVDSAVQYVDSGLNVEIHSVQMDHYGMDDVINNYENIFGGSSATTSGGTQIEKAYNYIIDSNNYEYMTLNTGGDLASAIERRVDNGLENLHSALDAVLNLNLDRMTKNDLKGTVDAYIQELLTGSSYYECVLQKIEAEKLETTKKVTEKIISVLTPYGEDANVMKGFLSDRKNIAALTNIFMENCGNTDGTYDENDMSVKIVNLIISSVGASLTTAFKEKLWNACYDASIDNIVLRGFSEASKEALSTVSKSISDIAGTVCTAISSYNDAITLCNGLITLRASLDESNFIFDHITEYVGNYIAESKYDFSVEDKGIIAGVVTSLTPAGSVVLLDEFIDHQSQLSVPVMVYKRCAELKEKVNSNSVNIATEFVENFSKQVCTDVGKEIGKKAAGKLIESYFGKFLASKISVIYAIAGLSFNLIDDLFGATEKFRAKDTIDIGVLLSEAFLSGISKYNVGYSSSGSVDDFDVAASTLRMLKYTIISRIIGERFFSKYMEEWGHARIKKDGKTETVKLIDDSLTNEYVQSNTEALNSAITSIVQARDVLFNGKTTILDIPKAPNVTLNYETMQTNEVFGEDYQYCFGNGEWKDCSGPIEFAVKQVKQILRVRKKANRTERAGNIATVVISAQPKLTKQIGVRFDGNSYILSNLPKDFSYYVCFTDDPENYEVGGFVHTGIDANNNVVTCSDEYAYMFIRTCSTQDYCESETIRINIEKPIQMQIDCGDGLTIVKPAVYFDGDIVTLKVSAQPGYLFKGWYKDGQLVSTDDELTFNAYPSCRIKAVSGKIKVSVVGIEIISVSKTDYLENEDFDPSTLTVVAHYDYAADKQISDFDVYGYEKTIGEKNVTVSYMGFTDQLNISVQHVTGEWKTEVEPTCTKEGTKCIRCIVCREVIQSEILPVTEHTYSNIITAPTCTTDGYTTHTCSVCGESYTDSVVKALGHTDSNNDGKCDTCGESLGTTPEQPENPSANCSCACHKKGIAKFFFKIGLFFQKIFKKNRICKCGVWHY